MSERGRKEREPVRERRASRSALDLESARSLFRSKRRCHREGRGCKRCRRYTHACAWGSLYGAWEAAATVAVALSALSAVVAVPRRAGRPMKEKIQSNASVESLRV